MNVAKIKKVLVINFFNLQHTKFDRLPHVIASHASEENCGMCVDTYMYTYVDIANVRCR